MSNDHPALALGKLPPELLARMLAGLQRPDARVVVPPTVGVDAAAIHFGDRLLIATADPITFVGERIGWYAVNVNANDIAVMGGVPRWFLATLLLPPDTTAPQVTTIMADLAAAADALGVTVVGGHTEVTHGLDRPILCGTMLGEAPLGGVITSAGVQPGDAIIVTGGIAIEGTAALAEVAAETLTAYGITSEALAQMRGLLDAPGISVVRAARTLTDAVAVHAMHDATEGGLATALAEMATASGVSISIDAATLPVLPETRLLCDALRLDPLGLLASGCLVAAVPQLHTASALAALHTAGISAWEIGIARAGHPIVRLTDAGHARPMPTFARDELARWLDR